jgi:pimeloyl-ACP methyl ester carboxylesterase
LWSRNTSVALAGRNYSCAEFLSVRRFHHLSFERCCNSDGVVRPVACASLRTLRDLGSRLTLFTNPRTGNKLEYLVVGDGPISDEVIVMFNGTAGVLSDWPIQMITNSAASPLIANTHTYEKAEDGTISLCHDYRLVLFDYPGVGLSPLRGNVTFDKISNDVDAMLTSLAARYGISTDSVDLVGWSLGTVIALKYAFVAPAANPARSINNLVLIATKPGGNTDGVVDGNQAPCVSTLFDFQKDHPHIGSIFSGRLHNANFELLFPYVGEPSNDGPSIDCTATIDLVKRSVTLNVTPDCPDGSECKLNELVQLANRLVSPWSTTKGVDPTLFTQQRELDADYSLCYCTQTDGNFDSTDCSCSGSAPEMSSSNGGMCQTISSGTTTPNAPISTNCVALNTGPITVINGPEDLYIQHTYGEELVTAYQQAYGADRATIVLTRAAMAPGMACSSNIRCGLRIRFSTRSVSEG